MKLILGFQVTLICGIFGQQEDLSDNIIDLDDYDLGGIAADPRQDGGCGRRTCNQFITGRNLPYSRALEIIQNEEYLSAIDLDEIRLKRAYTDNLLRRKMGKFKRRRRRHKRQSLSTGGGGAGNSGGGGGGGVGLMEQHIRMGGMAAAAAGGGVAAAGAAFMALPPSIIGVPGAGSPGSVLPAIGQPLPGAPGAGAIPPGAGPIPPGVGPGGVPVGQPIPGALPGSGILPIGNNPLVLEGVGLLEPLGLASGLVIPVAVFPPVEGQTFRAISVIFLELSAVPIKRSLSLWASKEANLLFRARKYEFQRPNAFKELRKKMEQRIRKLALNLKCFFPRLKHNLMQHEQQNNSRLKQQLNKAPMIQKRRSRVSRKGRPMKVTRMQMFARNCFPEPLYGFRTKVTLVDNEPCTIGVNCNATASESSPNNDFLAEYENELLGFRKRSFNAMYPPIKPNPAYPTSKFLRRQTGEEFASDGPPECRITVDPGNGCQAALTPNDLS